MVKKTVFICAITSDIGTELAKRYAKQGYEVIGTYRSTENLDVLKSLSKHLYYCDLNEKNSIKDLMKQLRSLDFKWDLFISCSGTQKPIGRFFECDFDKWSASIHINAIEQLRILHSIYPYRNKKETSNVVFFAGGGVNNASKNYSAYTISKIMLIKMCELLDFENPDLNIFILGPGWVKTKIHYETINEKKEIVGENHEKTIKFMENETGTSMDDIFDCINFFCLQGKQAAGGRNFSVVHDSWRSGRSTDLISELKADRDMYKLRRHKNNF